jgi:magnesium-transporting ATPase (P-type)
VALAFEPGEPGALDAPPRPPGQGLFDRLMVERTLLGGAVFGLVGIACYSSWLAEGRSLGEARNLLVQLFVLFEVLHIGNSRSEKTSIFRLNPFSNLLLFAGTVLALGVHTLALYTPFLQTLLDVQPVTSSDFIFLVAVASSILLVMEIHKAWRHFRPLST